MDSLLNLLKNLVYPSPWILFGFFCILAVDLVTGVRKAKKKGEMTTSKGLRRTNDKATTYFGLLSVVMIIMNVTIIAKKDEGFSWPFGFGLDALLCWFVYTEAKSVLENLIEINTNSDGSKTDICKKIIEPMHNILIFKISKKEQNG